MRTLIASLDKLAGEFDKLGFSALASSLDMVTNSIEKSAHIPSATRRSEFEAEKNKEDENGLRPYVDEKTRNIMEMRQQQNDQHNTMAGNINGDLIGAFQSMGMEDNKVSTWAAEIKKEKESIMSKLDSAVELLSPENPKNKTLVAELAAGQNRNGGNSAFLKFFTKAEGNYNNQPWKDVAKVKQISSESNEVFVSKQLGAIQEFYRDQAHSGELAKFLANGQVFHSTNGDVPEMIKQIRFLAEDLGKLLQKAYGIADHELKEIYDMMNVCQHVWETRPEYLDPEAVNNDEDFNFVKGADKCVLVAPTKRMGRNVPDAKKQKVHPHMLGSGITEIMPHGDRHASLV